MGRPSPPLSLSGESVALCTREMLIPGKHLSLTKVPDRVSCFWHILALDVTLRSCAHL